MGKRKDYFKLKVKIIMYGNFKIKLVLQKEKMKIIVLQAKFQKDFQGRR